MSPYEIQNQFEDYIIFRRVNKINNIFPTTGYDRTVLLPKDLARVRALVSQSLPCFALLVDRKFSSGPPSEAGGGQHCWLNSQHSSGWWWRSSQRTKPMLHHQWLVVRGICSEFNKPNYSFRFAAASAKYLSMHIAHSTDMISAFIYVLTLLGCTKW